HVRVRGCGRRRLGRRECLVVGFWLLGALMLLGQALGGEDAGVLILFWGFGGGSGVGMCWGRGWWRGRCRRGGCGGVGGGGGGGGGAVGGGGRGGGGGGGGRAVR